MPALQGLDLDVPPGTVFGFLGPNGAGKTTTLNILAGLVQPGEGEVRIVGLDVRTQAAAIRHRVGFLRQDPRFYPWMTARETLAFVGRLFNLTGAALASRIDELLELVGLRDVADRKLKGFSGGMRQRVGIAQALVGRPDVLLLDEPSSALDPGGRLEVLQIMERLKGDTTVFYSTHILQDVERIADEIVIVGRGRAIRQGSIPDLLRASDDELVIEVEGDPAALLSDLAAQPYVEAARPLEPRRPRERLLVKTTDLRMARTLLPRLVVAHEELTFVRCDVAQKDLESVFFELTAPPPEEAQT